MFPASCDLNPSVRVDSALLRQTVASGEKIQLGAVLSLAAAVEAIYISAVLHTRELPRVQARQKVWVEVSRLFTELAGTWTGANSGDPPIQWLRDRLEHFRELAIDQSELYVITLRERLRHAKNRGAMIETTRARGHQEPEPWHDARQGHIYSVAPFKAEWLGRFDPASPGFRRRTVASRPQRPPSDVAIPVARFFQLHVVQSQSFQELDSYRVM
jgi:hypothetical protein